MPVPLGMLLSSRWLRGGHLVIPVIFLLLVLDAKGGRWREERLRTLGERTGKSGREDGGLAYLTFPVHPYSAPAHCYLLYPQAGPFQPKTSSLPVCLTLSTCSESHLLLFLLMTSP